MSSILNAKLAYCGRLVADSKEPDRYHTSFFFLPFIYLSGLVYILLLAAFVFFGMHAPIDRQSAHDNKKSQQVCKDANRNKKLVCQKLRKP